MFVIATAVVVVSAALRKYRATLRACGERAAAAEGQVAALKAQLKTRDEAIAVMTATVKKLAPRVAAVEAAAAVPGRRTRRGGGTEMWRQRQEEQHQHQHQHQPEQQPHPAFVFGMPQPEPPAQQPETPATPRPYAFRGMLL